MLKLIKVTKLKRSYILLLFFFSLVFSFISILEIFIVGKFLNNIQEIEYFIGFIIILFLHFIFRQLLNFINYKFNLHIDKVFSEFILNFISEIPYFNYENEDFHREIYFIKDVVPKFKDYLKSIISLFSYFIRFLGYCFIVSTFVWYLGIIVFILFIPLCFVAIYSGNLEYENYLESGNFFRRASYFTKVLINKEFALERTSFKYNDFIKKKWKESKDKGIIIERKTLFFSEFYASVGIMLMMIILFTIFFMIIFFGKNSISFGLCTALISSLLVFTDEISYKLSIDVKKFVDSKLFLKKFINFISKDYSLAIEFDKTIDSIDRIEFKDVSYSYGNSYVLKNCSFFLERKNKYAIVGENGTGKTTLVKILLGLLDYEGSILINGVELREISRKCLVKHFGVIFQDFVKYEMTVSENIDFYNNNDIDEILKKVGIYEKIESFENGKNQFLGKLEEGISLSLGEWQKIALARLLIKNCDCLILDEPTASLDSISEREIIENVNSIIAEDNIGIWITHRLGSCRSCDYILVLKDGKIVENDTFKNLLNSDSYFKELYTTQRSWYDE
ncbi:ATP-binding cassette domain-containing protein [Parvimonas micra]|uniref:ATP-binding cassette domain-containing protein n=1 Tax=Parvimonas micra TaxID=33033 RepID=UPI0022B7493F|nr:ABC transporter ATP-binding protein [Parvimonas micra]MCZ7409325.1 ABC transporter ATP-binding protein/permease [Parvimonas micra]